MKLKSVLVQSTACLSCLFISSCTSYKNESAQNSSSEVLVLELRSEIDELRHLVNASQVEISLLEEKLDHRDHSIDALMGENSNLIKNREKSVAEKLEKLQKKISIVEQNQEKLVNDLKKISTSFNQSADLLKTQSDAVKKCEQDIAVFKSKIEDLSQISSTLKSLTSSMGSTASTSKGYKVQLGDSLEKIAKKHHVSVYALKKANNLSTDTIYVGKELIIPTND